MEEECKKLNCKLLEEKEKQILLLKQEIVAWKDKASIDQMTGAINKSEGLRKLRYEMSKSLIDNKSVTIAFVDIDRLKLINDKFGHCIGDQLLVNVSNILKTNIRKEDFIFRFGGDEFVIVFTNMTELQAKGVWKRICKVIRKFNRQKDLVYLISLSIGFYEYNGNTNLGLDKLIQLADDEMYKKKAKKEGISEIL